MEGDAPESSNSSTPVGDSHQAGDGLQPSLDKLAGAVNRVDEHGDVREEQRCQLLWYNKAIS